MEKTILWDGENMNDTERKYFEEHPELVDEILKKGTEKARQTAKATMKKVKKAMKLDYYEE